MKYSAIALLLVLAALGSLAHAADPQSYRVNFASVGDSDMDATIKATSDLQSLRGTAPVSPFGLIARARSDLDRLKTVVESFGYYQSSIAIKINGMTLTDPALGETLRDLAKGTDAQVDVGFTLGPLYHLRRIDIDGDLPDAARNALGLATGQPAVAAAVLAGGSRMLTALQEQSFPFAKVDEPIAYEDASEPVLDLRFHVETGAKANLGEIHIEGLKRVHESLVRKHLLLHTGDPYSPTAIERERRDLLALGVFSQISLKIGTEVDATGGVPVTFNFRERLGHAIGLNAAYSSDLGGSGGITWTDRNLRGYADQLTVAASVINFGGGDTTGVGYDTSVKYLIPDVGRRDQSLQFSVGALKQSLEAYDQTARTAAVTLSRKLSNVWTVSAGVMLTDEIVRQDPDGEDLHQDYSLLALPMNVTFDSTNLASPLDDPQRGLRAALSVTPTASVGHSNATFVIVQLKAATYFDLDHFLPIPPGRTVLAARGLAGIAAGAAEDSLPPDQRFYAGGSATIRGYGYQKVGPQFADGTPKGGNAITAGGLELRQRFGTNFGAALFVDAGQVSASLEGVPGEFRVGYGVGVRYFTPIGPIRLDVALPTVRGPYDDPYEIYIGLGQAF
jgi:translocation and assembly module TamA